jgi:hypothetical protein
MQKRGIKQVVRQARTKEQKRRLLYLAIGQLEAERMKLKRRAQELSARKNWAVNEIRELEEPRLIEVKR